MGTWCAQHACGGVRCCAHAMLLLKLLAMFAFFAFFKHYLTYTSFTSKRYRALEQAVQKYNISEIFSPHQPRELL